MTKFFGCVRNEFVKIFHQVKTWVMLALVVVSALGLNLINVMVQRQYNDYLTISSEFDSEFDPDLDRYYDNLINVYMEQKPEGYEKFIEQTRYLKEHKIAPDEWRNEAATELFAIQEEAEALRQSDASSADIQRAERQADSYEKAIETSDWKSYCALEIERLDANQSMTPDQREAAEWEYRYRLDNEVAYNPDDWRSNLVTRTAYTVDQLAQEGSTGDASERSKMEKSYKTAMYRLDHNLAVTADDRNNEQVTFWSVLQDSLRMIPFLSVFAVVIAGSCVASEFSSGTIKFLLVNPVKRGKLFAAKYAMVLGFSLLTLVLFYGSTVAASAVFWGCDLGLPHLYLSGGEVHEISGLLYMAWRYLLGGVGMVVAATLALAISCVMKSSALAIGISIFALVAGTGATTILKESFHQDWARYILFANTDLNAVIQGTTPFSNQSIWFALAVIAVYMVVFLLTAWDGFVRREV